jgi:hypothetical protein
MAFEVAEIQLFLSEHPFFFCFLSEFLVLIPNHVYSTWYMGPKIVACHPGAGPSSENS